MLAPPLQQIDRTFVLDRGKRLTYFGGCDYFRLASNPRLISAMEKAARRYGISVSASRGTTGNHPLYEKAEWRLARFFGAPAALLVSSGYVTNLVVAQAFAGRFSHVLIDERAHASLADAASLFECPILRFRHRDSEDLSRLVDRLGKHIRPIVLSDGLFSHDGSVAPLRRYLAVLPRDGMVLLDDSHGAGILGGHGRGTPEHERAVRARVIQTVTLSKAFGAYGGVVLCGPGVKKAITRRSRLFVGNTPLPLPILAAAMESLAILSRSSGPRRRLHQNATRVKSALRGHRLQGLDTPGPVVSVVPKDQRESSRLTRELRRRGVFPSLIRYPGGPAESQFRFAISSEHKRGQLTALVKALSVVPGSGS
jgi:7-keto-8-aminopelargonate synthetase-like enzyme